MTASSRQDKEKNKLMLKNVHQLKRTQGHEGEEDLEHVMSETEKDLRRTV